MKRTGVALLIVVLVAVIPACSAPDEHSSGAAPSSSARTAPSSSLSPRASASDSAGEGTAAACRLVDSAANGQLLDEALALSHNKPGTALRSAVAASYVEFARLLRQIAAGTTGKLVSALTAWSAASAKVGGYLARHEPRPGFVIDYGPTEKDWNAGRAAAEKVCGHPLPNTK